MKSQASIGKDAPVGSSPFRYTPALNTSLIIHTLVAAIDNTTVHWTLRSTCHRPNRTLSTLTKVSGAAPTQATGAVSQCGRVMTAQHSYIPVCVVFEASGRAVGVPVGRDWCFNASRSPALSRQRCYMTGASWSEARLLLPPRLSCSECSEA